MKYGRDEIVEWQLPVMQSTLERGYSALGLEKTITVLSYKEKLSKSECSNHRGKSLLGLSAKVYGRV